MSYFIFAVPMHEGLTRKHSCTSSTFPMAILNGTCIFSTVQLHVHKENLVPDSRNMYVPANQNNEIKLHSLGSIQDRSGITLHKIWHHSTQVWHYSTRAWHHSTQVWHHTTLLTQVCYYTTQIFHHTTRLQ